MSTNIPNQVSFLRTTRLFPEDDHQLSVELNKCYVDIANAVNSRTIGIFAINRESVTGESWFVSTNLTKQSLRQQSLRQAYNFDDSTLTFNHNLGLSSATNVTRIWGVFYDGTYWQTLPYVDVVNVTNQITVKLSSTQVVITKGAGAPPAMSKGLLVIEYLSNP